MSRDEIEIEPCFRYGAKVFLNRGGGISLVQATDFAGEVCLVFGVEEAVAVAKAILEVVETAKDQPKEVGWKSEI